MQLQKSWLASVIFYFLDYSKWTAVLATVMCWKRPSDLAVTAFDSENVTLHDSFVIPVYNFKFLIWRLSAYFEATDKLYIGSLFPNK